MAKGFFPTAFYGSKASSKSAPAPSEGHHGHGLFGLLNNLGSDVKDAVVGLPTGAVTAVEHPIRAGKAIVRATWHDWKPLVEGHPIAFAKQTYDHPLAPLLDVATVFSAGAGAGAKIGDALVEAGSTSKLAKAASDLGKSSSHAVTDTHAITEGRVPRPDMVKTHSASAGANLRRSLANRALLHLEPHLPAWFKQTAREGRQYDRLHHVDIAHRAAATNLQINAFMRAGKAIADPSLQHIIQPELLSHNYWNLRRYAHQHDVTQPLPQGYRYVQELTAANKDTLFAAKDGVPLESRMRTFGNDFTTSKAKNAATVNGGKHALIVPKQNVEALAQEGERSTRFLRTLAHKPVTLWKRVNVGYAPRVITNNAVGNWAMHAMRTGGEGGGRGFIDAIKYAHGNRAAMRAFKEMHAHIAETQGAEAAAKFTALAHPAITADPNMAAITHAFGQRAADAVKRPPDWQRQFFGDELGNVFGNVLDDNGKGSKLIKQGLYPIVHRVADEPVRVAALYQFMRRSPEVKAFLKTHPGAKLDESIQSVLKRNPGKLRERAVAHVRSIAGDYTSMNPVEKLVQNIVPFYLWDKHIAKHFGNMVSEKPGRVAAMQLTSRMGNDETKKLLGDVPGFMQGALPLSLFGMHEHNNRTPLLMTTGVNPYSTIGELAQTATALTTRHDATSGAEAASQISPILTGLVEQISGHKIGSQAPPDRHGGVIPSVLANTALGTSYGTLLKRIIEGTPHPKTNQTKSFSQPKPKDFLYEKTPQETAAGLFGLPVKNVSLTRAHDMAAADSGKKKRRANAFGAGSQKGAFK
jgi:hypothetical protein